MTMMMYRPYITTGIPTRDKNRIGNIVMINDVRKGPEHFAPGLFAAYQGGADAPYADFILLVN